MKRIAFIAFAYTQKYDGISVYIENLLRALHRISERSDDAVNIDVFVGTSVLELLKARAFDAVTPDRFKLVAVKDGNIGLKVLSTMIKLRGGLGYRTVFMPNLMPLPVPFAKSVRVIHDFSEIAVPEHYSAGRRRYIDMLVRMSLLCDDAVGYISEATRKDLKHFYGVGKSKKRLIYLPNGLPFKAGGSMASRTEKFDETSLRFLVVGRINTHKGYDRVVTFMNLFDAYLAEHRGQFEGVSLDIVGKKTPQSEAILSRLDAGSINVTIHGYVDDAELNALYDASHFCLFLSRNEGYGLPLIEAIKHQCFPVLSDIEIFKEIMSDEYRFFSDDTLEEIIAFVLTVMQERDRREGYLEQMRTVLAREAGQYACAAQNLMDYIDTRSR